MKLLHFVLITAVALPSLGYSQDSLYPQVKTTKKVPLAGAIINLPKCDDNGNIYLRVSDKEVSKEIVQGKRRHAQSPVYKIGPDGSLAGSFNVFELSPDLIAVPFFPASDGKVYMGAYDQDYGVYVVSFSGGSSGQKARLDSDHFLPYQIAVFKTGEILLSGVTGKHMKSVYTALFDSTGKLLKKIVEPEDEEARLKREAGESDFVPPGTPDTGNYFAMQGDATLGSDGNVYLLRSTGLIYVISHTGEVLKKIKVEPPQSGMTANVLRAAQDKLAVLFLNQDRTVGAIRILDYNGRPVATRMTDPSTENRLLACYASQAGSEGFAFVGYKDEQLAITRFKQE